MDLVSTNHTKEPPVKITPDVVKARQIRARNVALRAEAVALLDSPLAASMTTRQRNATLRDIDGCNERIERLTAICEQALRIANPTATEREIQTARNAA